MSRLSMLDDDSFEALAALRPLNTYGWSKALFDLFAARQAARDYAPPQWVGLDNYRIAVQATNGLGSSAFSAESAGVTPR